MPGATKHKAPPVTGSRSLIPDPDAPGIPARGGLPMVPKGYREATPAEIWLWEAKADRLLSGAAWSESDRREMADYYAAHRADAAKEAA